MPVKGRNDAFSRGMGVPEEQICCSECGYTSPKNKNFRKDGSGGHTCSTGHYETKDGEKKRQKNLYAARGR